MVRHAPEVPQSESARLLLEVLHYGRVREPAEGLVGRDLGVESRRGWDTFFLESWEREEVSERTEGTDGSERRGPKFILGGVEKGGAEG